jgi:hypothetical protein
MSKSMIACMLTFTIIAISLPLLVCSQAPGITEVQQLFLPLSPGYSRIFGISRRLATFVAVPTTALSGLSFFVVAAKQLNSMGRSGYLPLGGHGRRGDVSEASYVCVAVVSLTIKSISVIPGLRKDFKHDFPCLALLGAFSVYMWTFVGYSIYKKHYCRTDSGFKAPFGIYTAAVGFLIFALSLMSLLVLFDGGNYRLVIYYVVYFAMTSAVYLLYSSKHMIFSETEQKVMFGAYVVKGESCALCALCMSLSG